jgi:multidrug efflux pump subunit AcrA (membrane-fusion protein)
MRNKKSNHKQLGLEKTLTSQLQASRQELAAALQRVLDLRLEISRLRGFLGPQEFSASDPLRYLDTDMVVSAKAYLERRKKPASEAEIIAELIKGAATQGKSEPESQVRRMLGATKGGSLKFKNGKFGLKQWPNTWFR